MMNLFMASVMLFSGFQVDATQLVHHDHMAQQPAVAAAGAKPWQFKQDPTDYTKMWKLADEKAEKSEKKQKELEERLNVVEQKKLAVNAKLRGIDRIVKTDEIHHKELKTKGLQTDVRNAKNYLLDADKVVQEKIELKEEKRARLLEAIMEQKKLQAGNEARQAKKKGEKKVLTDKLGAQNKEKDTLNELKRNETKLNQGVIASQIHRLSDVKQKLGLDRSGIEHLTSKLEFETMQEKKLQVELAKLVHNNEEVTQVRRDLTQKKEQLQSVQQQLQTVKVTTAQQLKDCAEGKGVPPVGVSPAAPPGVPPAASPVVSPAAGLPAAGLPAAGLPAAPPVGFLANSEKSVAQDMSAQTMQLATQNQQKQHEQQLKQQQQQQQQQLKAAFETERLLSQQHQQKAKEEAQRMHDQAQAQKEQEKAQNQAHSTRDGQAHSTRATINYVNSNGYPPSAVGPIRMAKGVNAFLNNQNSAYGDIPPKFQGAALFRTKDFLHKGTTMTVHLDSAATVCALFDQKSGDGEWGTDFNLPYWKNQGWAKKDHDGLKYGPGPYGGSFEMSTACKSFPGATQVELPKLEHSTPGDHAAWVNVAVIPASR